MVVIIAGVVVAVTVPAPLLEKLGQDLSASIGFAGEMTMMLVILTISIVTLLGVFVMRGGGLATVWSRIADEYARLVAPMRRGTHAALREPGRVAEPKDAS
jgi:hypothetical protein